MTSEAVFEYRCRRCGKISQNPVVNADYGQLWLWAAIRGDCPTMPGSPRSMELEMMECCNCPDGGMGIADLIGYSVRQGQWDCGELRDDWVRSAATQDNLRGLIAKEEGK